MTILHFVLSDANKAEEDARKKYLAKDVPMASKTTIGASKPML